MRTSKPATFSTFLLLVLVLLFTTGAIVGEARLCDYASRKFKGVCVSDRNCEGVCATEGFPSGHCHGFRRRCMCSRVCHRPTINSRPLMNSTP